MFISLLSSEVRKFFFSLTFNYITYKYILLVKKCKQYKAKFPLTLFLTLWFPPCTPEVTIVIRFICILPENFLCIFKSTYIIKD